MFTEQPNGLLADTIEFSFFALNDDGQPQARYAVGLNLAIRPNTHQRVKTLGVRFNSTNVDAPQGRYQLRIGARDLNGGKAGTVF